MWLYRCAISVTRVASRPSICGFALRKSAFLWAVEKRCLITAPLMPKYGDYHGCLPCFSKSKDHCVYKYFFYICLSVCLFLLLISYFRIQIFWRRLSRILETYKYRGPLPSVEQVLFWFSWFSPPKKWGAKTQTPNFHTLLSVQPKTTNSYCIFVLVRDTILM